MILRLVAFAFLAVTGSFTMAASSYRMTYQVTSTSREMGRGIQSFAIARKVTTAGNGGRMAAQPKPSSGPSTSGRLTFRVPSSPSATASPFKKGATFYRMTVMMSGTSPKGVQVLERTWTISNATVTGYSVAAAGKGGMMVATVDISWESIKVS